MINNINNSFGPKLQLFNSISGAEDFVKLCKDLGYKAYWVTGIGNGYSHGYIVRFW